MLNLFFPHLCCGCDRRLLDGNQLMCVNCRDELPLCFPKNLKENSFTRRFYGRIRLETGFSLLRFESSGHARTLIHKLKYKGRQDLGVFFGQWLAALLTESDNTPDYDCIIPVPLSKSRMRKRGYNQVSRFARQLGESLNVKVDENAIYRGDKTKSSVLLSRRHRFEKQQGFELFNDFKVDNYRHILIVDDTITTGATLEACAKVMLNQGQFKLSFATIAMTD